VPSAIVRALRYARQWNASLPLYITECGWSTDGKDHSLQDDSRVQFYRQYIGAALYCEFLKFIINKLPKLNFSIFTRRHEFTRVHSVDIDGRLRMAFWIYATIRSVSNGFQVGNSVFYLENLKNEQNHEDL
jgi:hypothetical protein